MRSWGGTHAWNAPSHCRWCKASAPALHRASRSVLPPLGHPSPPQVLAQLLDLFANMIRWRPDSVQTYEFFRRCAREFRQVGMQCAQRGLTEGVQRGGCREFRRVGMCTKGGDKEWSTQGFRQPGMRTIGVHREFSSCCWDSLSERSGVNVIACPHDGGELVCAY